MLLLFVSDLRYCNIRIYDYNTNKNNESPRNQSQKQSHCWSCNNMPLNMISLCCHTSSCSDTRSDMCKSSVPTGYSALVLLSCKPALVRSLLSSIHYFRAAGDAGLQSEPFCKQTSDSSLFSSVEVRCQMWVGEARSSAFCFDKTRYISTHPRVRGFILDLG